MGKIIKENPKDSDNLIFKKIQRTFVPLWDRCMSPFDLICNL